MFGNRGIEVSSCLVIEVSSYSVFEMFSYRRKENCISISKRLVIEVQLYIFAHRCRRNFIIIVLVSDVAEIDVAANVVPIEK